MKTKHFSKALQPPRDFFNSAKEYFDVVEFIKSGKTIKTTRRKSERTISTRLQSNTNFEKFTRFVYVGIILATKRRIEVQWHCFTREIVIVENEPTEIINSNLVNLIVLENNDCYKYINRQLNGLGYHYDLVWYRQDIAKVLSKSELKYTLALNYDQFDDNHHIKAYKYREIIEVLCNFGAVRMAADIVKGSLDMRKITEKWLRVNKRYLKLGLHVNEINQLDFIKKYYTLNENTIERIRSGALSKSSIESVLEYETERNIKARKLLRYLDKQKRSLYYYKDYLRMMDQLGVALETWKDWFPIDLELAHDNASKKLLDIKNAEELLKQQKLESTYKLIVGKLKKLEKETDEFCLFVPNSLEEIWEEGKALSHCVYGDHYLNRHSMAESIIMFVRKTSKPELPFFTLEMDSQGNLVQLHGYGNEGRSELGKEAEAIKPVVKHFVDSVMTDSYKKDAIKKIKKCQAVVKKAKNNQFEKQH